MTDSQPTAAELRAVIGGVYCIAAWYDDDGEELRPPRAHDRYVLVDGQVVSSLFKTDADGSNSIHALYGCYEIENGAFSYGYDFGTLITISPDGAMEKTEIGSDQIRRFAVHPRGRRCSLVERRQNSRLSCHPRHNGVLR